jgi:hypothetical protein
MKTVIILFLVASLSGCAAFCDSNDIGCINKANAVSASIAAAGVATLGAAAAYEASRPVYVAPAPVIIVQPRRCYGYYCY